MSNGRRVLDEDQKTAVTHGEGPLLIVAGAGTGKTTVITRRVEYLISKRQVRPDQVLALTFTEKAAREMEERVDQLLPYGYTETWISTFHAFCDRVLRRDGIEIGLNPAYHLMTQSEAIQFFRANLFSFPLEYFRPLGNPNKFVWGLLAHFSRLQDEDITFKQYREWVAATKELSNEELKKFTELAEVYQRYTDLKARQDVLDFADLVSWALKLFRTRRSVLARYRKQFTYLLVDEFQDTNRAQNELAILLAGKKANLTVCGDDDQSVYRFRGAAVANILQFREHFPQAKIVVLKKNYRSGQKILNRAYRLIQHNNPDRLEVQQGVSKHLLSQRQGVKGKVELLIAKRVEEEAEQVVGKILTVRRRGYHWGEIAILVRANNHAEPFVRALVRAGIPYQFLGPGKLLRQEEVTDLIAYLRVLDNFEDNVATYRVLSMPIFRIEARDLAVLVNAARKQNLALFEICEQADQLRIADSSKQAVAVFVKMIHRHLELVRSESAGQILYYFLQDSGLLKSLADYQTVSDERRAENIAQFFNRLKSYEADHKDASVPAVVAWLNLALEMGESPLAGHEDWTEEDRVSLLTVHSSKGLEFRVVFLVDLVGARFPTRNRPELIPLPEKIIKEPLPEGDAHLQEERRLCYVGMTRARDELYLAAARFYGEEKREKKLSPFLPEIFGAEKVGACLQKLKKAPTGGFFLPDWSKKTEEKQTSVPAAVSYLSYTQLSAFETCPLQYKYRYVNRIPTPPSAAQSFGSTIHRTLELFYERVQNKKKPTLALLLGFFDQAWISLGYTSHEHQEKMKNVGKKMLEQYWQVIFDPQREVVTLEKLFGINLGTDFKVGGKIDRIDRWGEGLEIVDYKTGSVWSQKEVDGAMQMTVYALAVNSPRSTLNLRLAPEKIKLSFCFLQTGEIKSTARTIAQLGQAEKELVMLQKNISQSPFLPTPGRWCDFCDYKLICEAWE